MSLGRVSGQTGWRAGFSTPLKHESVLSVKVDELGKRMADRAEPAPCRRRGYLQMHVGCVKEFNRMPLVGIALHEMQGGDDPSIANATEDESPEESVLAVKRRVDVRALLR